MLSSLLGSQKWLPRELRGAPEKEFGGGLVPSPTPPPLGDIRQIAL